MKSASEKWEKKVYSQSYDEVFRACRLALRNLKYIVKEAQSNYFFARSGFFSSLFGHYIKIYLMEYSYGHIQVYISSTSSFLLLFSKRTANKIFSEVDRILLKK